MGGSSENGGSSEDFNKLELVSTIGFNGFVNNGIIVHPDREHMLYPIGCNLVIRNINKGTQEFLSGHENNISCVAISKSGKYVATGQVTFMGFKAPIIIWDFEQRRMLHMMTLHKVKVEDLAFSPSESYLVSVGGEDDCTCVLWDVKTGKTVCGGESALKSNGNVTCVRYCNVFDDVFVTGGDNTLRVWWADVTNKQMEPTECNLGAVRRVVNCIQILPDDEFFYCGTTTGDIIKVSMKTKKMRNIGPMKKENKHSGGITALQLLKTGELLVGTGLGKVMVVKTTGDKYPVVRQSKVVGEVTSVALRGEGHQFFTGTKSGHVNRFNFLEFTQEQIITAPSESVEDVAFPTGTSLLFATCSGGQIRVWHTTTSRELLRIDVPNMKCNCIHFTEDGQSILSGWEDGKIRCFTPETGKEMYVMNNCHCGGVSSLDATNDCMRIVSGGGEGQVRVWDLTYQPMTQKFVASMKEHITRVNDVKLHANNKEVVSASEDGTCIIWDLISFRRKQMVLSNTQFKCVAYHPVLPQIVTSGTDRKICYWETLDGVQIRELEGSKSGSVNDLDITSSGKVMITGGEDRLLKLWNYADGVVSHVGIGHSGKIRACKICPNLNYIVSVSQDGAVLVWQFPRKTEDLP